MNTCFKKVASDPDGTIMFVMLDSKDHVLNELLRQNDLAVSFELGEFYNPDTQWIISTPLVASNDEENFVEMMYDFDLLMDKKLGDVWKAGKEWFSALPFDIDSNDENIETDNINE